MTYSKEEIIAKAREVADMIAQTEEVEFFKRAEAQINENQKVREKIASLKSLQKQAVNFQAYGKERALGLIDIITSTGGDLLRGETGSKVEASKPTKLS
jgi:cell fate (sporulation/competence/biofilm development) regulator YmcA (YheA/YmcA/DUF963 family)